MADRKNILVTGGAGYIGSAVVRRLIQIGHNVRVVDLCLYNDEPFDDLNHHPQLELVKGDIRDLDLIESLLHDSHTVIHLAGLVGDPACAVDPELTVDINVTATRALAQLVAAHKIPRMIFASSCSVYGASLELLHEQSTVGPLSLYAKSKLASEFTLQHEFGHAFEQAILRFGTIYGVSDRLRLDLVVNLLSAKAIQDGVITVSGGAQWRPFVHVADAALAVTLAVDASPRQLEPVVFNVGSNAHNYTISNVGQIIRSIVPTAELVIDLDSADPRDYRVDFTRILRYLNFRPTRTIEIGVSEVAMRLRELGTVAYQDRLFNNKAFLDGAGVVDGLLLNRPKPLTTDLEASILDLSPAVSGL